MTSTVKLHADELPEASVTTNVLVVIPTGNVEPDERPDVCIVVAPGQLSVPTGAVYVTTALTLPVLAVWEILPGQLITGSSSSVIVILKLHDDLLPEPSVTTKVLVVVPTGKAVPDAKPVVCAVVAPEQLSVPTGAV